MNNVQVLIRRAGKAVAAVFAGFGGFVLNVQPPEGIVKGFTIGFASTLSALLFLVISIFSQRYAWNQYRRIFTTLSLLFTLIVVLVGFLYQSTYSALTLDLPSANGTEKIIIGTELTHIAREALAKTNEPLPQLLLDFGGKGARERVWTRESIRAATLMLNDRFIALAVSIAAAIFCVAEVLFPAMPSAQ